MQKMHKKANTVLWVVAIVVVLVLVALVGNSQGWFDGFIGSDDGDDDAVCGDGQCTGDETLATCADDCLQTCDLSVCGDGYCRYECGEAVENCAADCTDNPCASEYCGNGNCNAGCYETTNNCEADCGSGGTAALPIEQLNAKCKDKFTMAADTTGNLSFYALGADVSNPYILALDEIGCGTNTTNMIVQTNTQYDVWYDSEGATNYDEKITNWDINYNPSTGKGFLLIGGKSYYSTSVVGAFVSTDTLPEVQTGMFDNGTKILSYNETVLGGSGWFKMDVGNANANSELRDVVLCFRDADSDLEGNEVTAFTASYVSGSTAISIPGSLQTYWEDAAGGGGNACVKIADVIGSAEKARWQFTMTVNEANFEEQTEEFTIDFDDVGGYLKKQYPSRNAKATAETLTIYTIT